MKYEVNLPEELWQLPKNERNTLKRRIKRIEEIIAHNEKQIIELENRRNNLIGYVKKDKEELEKLLRF